MELTLLSGSANPGLSAAIAGSVGIGLAARRIERFPDGEIHVEIQQSVRGHDVYLVQPTGPPVDGNLLELLLLADACRRAGARRLTAVIPYFGYARQDRRAAGRDSVGARLIADLLAAAELDRVVAVDLHGAALEGFFAMPMEHLSAVPPLAEALRRLATPASVIVAPDLGAAKLADRYARLLDLPVAVVHKTRLSGSAVSVRGVTGEVRGRRPLIVDDMISTGGTIAAAIEALVSVGASAEVTVAVSHGLLVGPAVERLRAARVRRLIMTDSVPPPAGIALPAEIVSLGSLLASAIARLHRDQSLGDLVPHG